MWSWCAKRWRKPWNLKKSTPPTPAAPLPATAAPTPWESSLRQSEKHPPYGPFWGRIFFCSWPNFAKNAENKNPGEKTGNPIDISRALRTINSVFEETIHEEAPPHDKRYDHRLPHEAGAKLRNPPDVRQPVPAVLLHGGHHHRGALPGHRATGGSGLHRLYQLLDSGLLHRHLRRVYHS